jgi:hypothetical protein
MKAKRSVAAAVALVCAVVACGGSDGDDASDGPTTTDASVTTTSTEPSDTTTTTEAGPPTGAVGEPVTTAECCALTVHGVTDPYPADQLNPIFQPQPGDRAVAVDVEFVVHEGEPRGVNFADMTVRDDAGAFNSFVTVVGGGQLDNAVQPGAPLRVTLIFRVDSAATGLRFEYAPLVEPQPLAVVPLS